MPCTQHTDFYPQEKSRVCPEEVRESQDLEKHPSPVRSKSGPGSSEPYPGPDSDWQGWLSVSSGHRPCLAHLLKPQLGPGRSLPAGTGCSQVLATVLWKMPSGPSDEGPTFPVPLTQGLGLGSTFGKDPAGPNQEKGGRSFCCDWGDCRPRAQWALV